MKRICPDLQKFPTWEPQGEKRIAGLTMARKFEMGRQTIIRLVSGENPKRT
jgi:hypothetical protein